MNAPALLCALKTLRDPALCLPHATIPQLSHLPIPVSKGFTRYRPSLASEKQQDSGLEPDIRAVILDKDNTFALANSNTIDPSCTSILDRLRAHYGSDALLIVSNTAGLFSKDPDGFHAAQLEKETGISVLRHKARKPAAGCGQAAFEHLRAKGVINRADQVTVVGDRLFTDVVMAKRMGAWAVWLREGVRQDTGLWTRGENWLFDMLTKRGLSAARP